MQRRAFNQLPAMLKTDQNSREFYIADDQLFEPESSQFITGYIGDTSVLTEEDLKRTPELIESDPVRQKYQFGVGVAYVDPDTEEYLSGAFYPDLVRHLAVNGAIVDDPNRLFGSRFYAWRPPINYDKHINFSRYSWIGGGNARSDAEYITKEQVGSQTRLYYFDGTALSSRVVRIVNGVPATGTDGDLVEDASTANRIIYLRVLSSWVVLAYTSITDVTETAGLRAGDYAYVCRTGPNFNRPLIYVYKENSGRWIPIPVVISQSRPDTPRIGMLWEDVSALPNRIIRVYTEQGWVPLTWTYTPTRPTGTPANNTYMYDGRDMATRGDGWTRSNWWVAYEDLSPSDRSYLTAEAQAVRPILEFWSAVEPAQGDAKTSRNQKPRFNLYGFDLTSGEIKQLTSTNFPGLNASVMTSTIFEYASGSVYDSVLDFNVSFTNSGDYKFSLTLETDTITISGKPLNGYRMFRDDRTGLIHNVWALGTDNLQQSIDSNGLYEIPKNLISNANHDILVDPDRSKILEHMSSIIAAQENFSGDRYGTNSYRFSDQDPTRGATIIDPEASLLRGMALLQSTKTDVPETIRSIAREYNKIMYRFFMRMKQRWESGDISHPDDTLKIATTSIVDSILSDIFVGRTDDFPFFYSSMGTFRETRIFNGTAIVVDPQTYPIFIPPSAPRLGLAPAYLPGTFRDRDGILKVRGHDGSLIPAFGDGRDQIILELEGRFYDAIPDARKVETETYSARFNTATFCLEDFYGNYIPYSIIGDVDEIVPDFSVLAPEAGKRVYSVVQAAYAISDGVTWSMKVLIVDDVFFNIDNGEYYIFNGFYAVEIASYNKAFEFDYSTNEFRNILRRDFDRYSVGIGGDFSTNAEFNNSDPFTWNYRSAGVEGNYKGIYRRLYGTIRPHSHPWEIAGYATRPNWWYAEYPPNFYANDGTPRYLEINPMWNALQAGIVNPISGFIREDRAMLAPIPVSNTGDLLDPIAAGIITEGQLDLRTIDDDWVYGDGASSEQQFLESYYYPFSVALCAYLMKPAIVLETLWSDYYLTVGTKGANKIWRAPHLVYRDTLTRPREKEVLHHLSTDSNGKKIQNIGINSWIAEIIVANGGSADRDFDRLVSNVYPTLGWLTSRFINKNRTVIEPATGKEIPYEDIHVILHQTPALVQTFMSGMIVVREGSGFRVYGYDSVNPNFRVDVAANPILGGQTEYKQTFAAETDQHEFVVTENFNIPQQFDTARFAVVANGYKLDSKFVQVIDAKTFRLDPAIRVVKGDIVVASVVTAFSNPSTQARSFTVQGIQFSYVTASSGETVDYAYGHYFETINEVVNMMVGYGRFIIRQGWIFDQDDNGVEIDWLFGAKVFADWALRTAKQADGDVVKLEAQQFFYCPFRTKAKISVPFGHILNVESLQNGVYGLINRSGIPIRAKDAFVSRIGDTLTVEVKPQDEEIYGIRAYITEIQHVVFLSNRTKFNDLIYDPVLSLFHKAMRVDTYGTAGWNGRLEAPGHVIHRGELLPNFEKQVADMARFYSRTNPVDDPTTRDQARALYGYTPKSYMDVIDADDRMKFNFHLGAQHAKGTSRAYKAFLRGTRTGTENTQIREVWAWKISQYGDVRYETVEFRINKVDFVNRRQVIQFADATDSTSQTLVITPFVRPTSLNDPSPTHPRWIVPPQKSASGTANFEFPTTNGTQYDIVNFSAMTKVIDRNVDQVVESLFHWEPQRGLHEPLAFSKVDDYGSYDPARYNRGPGAVDTANVSWGSPEEGRLWFDTSKASYVDPLSRLPNLNDAAREWGKLEYYLGGIVRQDEVVTVTTRDPYTNQVVPHGLVTGDTVTITGADQVAYNQVDIAVTVTSASTFTFITDEAPFTPGTGTIVVRVGDVRVYEWVRSPVQPSAWEDYVGGLTDPDSYTGAVLNSATPSYVETSRRDSSGNVISTYFFWVRSNKRINPKKMISSFEVENRLRDPSTYGLSFFAPMTRTIMFVSPVLRDIKDNFSLVITNDQRELNSNIEWALVGENSGFVDIPALISTKVFDSICGQTADGKPVPNPTLSVEEKYGNAYSPAQTIFQDTGEAVDVYVEAFNRLMATKLIQPLDSIIKVLPLEEERTDFNPNGYWERTDYVDASVVDKPVYETLATIQERDFRTMVRLYAFGDVVKVKQTSNLDPWTAEPVGALYQLERTGWRQVGVERSTANINAKVGDDPNILRSILTGFNDTESVTRTERNNLVFSLLYEMMRQSQFCDWFIKTSYMDVEIAETIEKTPYVRVPESDAIISAINDLKPYRTKVRSEIISASMADSEDVAVEALEFPSMKIGVTFDRLSCTLLDDGGWDSISWAAWDDKEWDYPVWEYDDLGRKFFRKVGTITPNGSTTRFTLSVNSGTPFLYDFIGKIMNGSTEVINSGVTLTFLKNTKTVTVVTSSALPSNYTLDIYMAQGLWEGIEPENDAMMSSYRHHVARTFNQDYNPCPDMSGCSVNQVEDPLGGDAEERIKTELTERVSIYVKTFPDYNTTGISDRSFAVLLGPQEVIPAGMAIFPTSEDREKGIGNAIAASSQFYRIGAVYFNIGSGFVLKTENVHYRIVAPYTHEIEILPPPDVYFMTNGIQTSYTFPQIEVGIADLYKGNVLQVNGIDYSVTGTDTVNILTAPVVGVQYRIVQKPYISLGGTVRLLYRGYDMGIFRGYTVLTYPASYEISGRIFEYNSNPPANQTLTVRYDIPRMGGNPQSLLAAYESIEAIYSSRNLYDGITGTDENRESILIIDDSDNHFYRWSGIAWIDEGPTPVGVPFFVRRTQEIVAFDGNVYPVLWRVGTLSADTAVLAMPPGGTGLTYGPLYYGTLAGADLNYPTAYQIVQHQGDFS